MLHEADGRGGSAWMHGNVKVGDKLKIRGPRNHFHLDESATKLIFVAGGIGITPVSAMARGARRRWASTTNCTTADARAVRWPCSTN